MIKTLFYVETKVITDAAQKELVNQKIEDAEPFQGEALLDAKCFKWRYCLDTYVSQNFVYLNSRLFLTLILQKYVNETWFFVSYLRSLAKSCWSIDFYQTYPWFYTIMFCQNGMIFIFYFQLISTPYKIRISFHY